MVKTFAMDSTDSWNAAEAVDDGHREDQAGLRTSAKTDDLSESSMPRDDPMPRAQAPARRSKNPCAVATCNIAGSVSHHRFPRDPKIRRAWLQACKRTDALNLRICSRHFRDADYERDLRNELLGLPVRKLLKKDAVPSMYLNNNKDPSNKKAELLKARAERMRRRENQALVAKILEEAAMKERDEEERRQTALKKLETPATPKFMTKGTNTDLMMGRNAVVQCHIEKGYRQLHKMINKLTLLLSSEKEKSLKLRREVKHLKSKVYVKKLERSLKKPCERCKAHKAKEEIRKAKRKALSERKKQQKLAKVEADKVKKAKISRNKQKQEMSKKLASSQSKGRDDADGRQHFTIISSSLMSAHDRQGKQLFAIKDSSTVQDVAHNSFSYPVEN